MALLVFYDTTFCYNKLNHQHKRTHFSNLGLWMSYKCFSAFQIHIDISWQDQQKANRANDTALRIAYVSKQCYGIAINNGSETCSGMDDESFARYRLTFMNDCQYKFTTLQCTHKSSTLPLKLACKKRDLLCLTEDDMMCIALQMLVSGWYVHATDNHRINLVWHVHSVVINAISIPGHSGRYAWSEIYKWRGKRDVRGLLSSSGSLLYSNDIWFLSNLMDNSHFQPIFPHE